MAKTGNPFIDDSKYIIVLISGVVAPSEAAENVLTIQQKGREKYEEYCKTRLGGEVSIHEKISKNNIPLFKSGKIRNVDRKARKMEDLRSDCSLFS